MKILFSPFSPYVRKCLVTGHEVGLNDRIQLLPSAANPVNRDRDIIPNNPLGKVPTFFTDSGEVLYDSRVICEYLNDMGKGVLFPSGAARWPALTLQSLADGMLDAALLTRYEGVMRPEQYQWADWANAQYNKVETSLDHLNAHPSSLESGVHIGTIAVGCALWYLDLRFADRNWRDRAPRVAEWYARFSQREAMRMAWSL
ncbi:MAG: glutathione S-transferase [Rubrivivax sp.]